MADTVRTFIAVEMPPEVREFLGRCQDRLRRAGGDVRWARPDLIHLTLAFLGEVAVGRIEDLGRAVAGAVAGVGPMTLRPHGAGRFPPRGAPRVVWVGIEEPSGRLLALQKAVADAAAPFAEKAEDRAYQAHLTLGRAKTGKNAAALGQAVDALADEAGPAFEAREVVVMKSVLAPGGPTYTALARIALGKEGPC